MTITDRRPQTPLNRQSPLTRPTSPPPSPKDAYAASQPQQEPAYKPSLVPQLSLLSKVVLTGTLGLTALTGMAAPAGTHALMATQVLSTQPCLKDLTVTVLPEGTPRLDVIRAPHSDYSRVGTSLGGGLFEDLNGNLSLLPLDSLGWDSGARDFARVDMGANGKENVQRYGTTIQYVESSTRRTIFTEHDNRLEVNGRRGKTVFDANPDGSLHVRGPRQDYTVRPGLVTHIERPGKAPLLVLHSATQLRVVEGDLTKASASLLEDGSLTMSNGRSQGTATRSDNGLIINLKGSGSLPTGRIIHDGGTYLGRRDKDAMTVDNQKLLAESKARYDMVMKQLDSVEPGFAEKHPVVASVLEYAAANPRLLGEEADHIGFLQAGTLLASTGGAMETVSALGAQAAALNLANSARALGAAALSAQAAAQAQAAAGNLAQAGQLAHEAQDFATRAHQAKDQAIKTGGKALKASNLARVMAGVGGVLQIVDGVVGIHHGRADRSLVQGAIAVTQASMEQFASRLQGDDRIAAQDDFDKVMRVMNEQQTGRQEGSRRRTQDRPGGTDGRERPARTRSPAHSRSHRRGRHRGNGRLRTLGSDP